jgi:diguanylate cyclase (GGDEF)-like protein
MRVSETLLFTLITVGLGDAVNFWSLAHHGRALQYPPVIAIVHAVAFVSVVSRAAAEQNMRRSFAKGITLQLHIEDLSRANSKLLELSRTDPLTGLANRRYFDTTLEQAWQRAIETRQPLAGMMIDVDHFKLFNDTAGHQEGDRCLVTIARTIDRQLRKGQDTVARFGGEEFVVLMPDTDADLAAGIADRVHAAISAQRVFHPRSACGFVSVSIGVAAIRPSPGVGSPDALIAAADKALYEAKAAGRDQVAYAFA